MRRRITPIPVSLLLIGLSIFCDLPAYTSQRQAGGITGHPVKGGSVSIRDANGRSIHVKLPVKRVVVLTSDALEVIRAIKAEELVVGVNSGIAGEPLFWSGLNNRASVGSWRNPNYELIAELDPDIVIGYAQRPGPVMEKKLSAFGIQVIRLDFYKILTLEKEIAILGQILERENEARQLIAWYHRKLNLIQERLRHIRYRPHVYVESYSRYHTTGPGSGGNEMCVLAGGHNIAASFSIPYPEVTPEWVLVKNPQVIVKAAAVSNAYTMNDPVLLKEIRKDIIARPAWDNIRAVQEGRVYVIESSIWTGPRGIIGVSYMAKWFFPDIFEDLAPEESHREYLKKFQGIKYRGAYVVD